MRKYYSDLESELAVLPQQIKNQHSFLVPETRFSYSPRSIKDFSQSLRNFYEEKRNPNSDIHDSETSFLEHSLATPLKVLAKPNLFL